MELADPKRVLFGSDFPFSRHRNPADDVRSVIAAFEAFDGWRGSVRRGIEYENALSLFPRLATAVAKAS
jgi:predicted TIM-barrel fold metal-dependent hydrolase